MRWPDWTIGRPYHSQRINVSRQRSADSTCLPAPRRSARKLLFGLELRLAGLPQDEGHFIRPLPLALRASRSQTVPSIEVHAQQDWPPTGARRSEEHTSELQSRENL